MPAKIVAKLRMEKKGRGGKTVSVVYDLPRNDAFLKELCQELKRACGTGGAVQDDTIELQGDLRDRIRDCLAKKGLHRQGLRPDLFVYRCCCRRWRRRGGALGSGLRGSLSSRLAACATNDATMTAFCIRSCACSRS